MNSSLGFRFRKVALASVIFGLIAGACDVGVKAQGGPCTVTADCAAGSECSDGHCVPYTACMTDAQCAAGQQCASGACRTTCTTDAQCASLGFLCALPAGQCMPKPTMSVGGSGGTSASGAGSAGMLSTGGSGGEQTSGGGASGSGGGMAMGPTSDLVDDLEDNDGRITMTAGRQGGWYAFSDGSIMPPVPDDNANMNPFMPASPGAHSSMHAVHVSASGFPNYAGVAVDFNNSGVRPKDTANRKVYDVSAYDGVVFQAKGMSSGSMRVMAVTQQIAGKAEGGTCDDSNTANHCWESYGKDFTLSSDWTEVRVRFSDMTTGNSSPFDPKSVFGLAFQDNAQNGSLDLWIDDLALFKDGTPVGGGGTGSGGTSSGGSGNGSSGATSCSSLPGSPNPGSGSFTFYYFGQGTAQEGGKYKTACGYTGTESGMTDTVSNIVNPTYFAAIPGASNTNFDTVGHCGECVKITNGGTSIVATIIDECPVAGPYPNPACTPEHLDLSWQAWKDLGYNVGNPSGTTWQFVPCDVKGNVQLSFNGPNEVYIQNLVVPVQSVTMNGAMGNHTSYGSWQFGSGVQGQMLTITDVAGRTITVTANGDTGKQFPGCN